MTHPIFPNYDAMTPDPQPVEVPLVEQLESVPINCHEMIEVEPMHHRYIPYGRLCHEAAVRIRRLESSNHPPAAEKMSELCARIRSYLCNGGFFNPEMMEHDKVRALLLDIRDYFYAPPPEQPQREEGDAPCKLQDLTANAPTTVAATPVGSAAPVVQPDSDATGFTTDQRKLFDAAMKEIEPQLRKICDELEDCTRLSAEDLQIVINAR